MNGVHDMGGAQCYGPVVPERDEPLFHHPWEARAMGITVALGASGEWNLDQSRSARESLPPEVYLSSSYYEIWVRGLEKLLAERGLLGDSPRAIRRVLDAASVPASLARGSPTLREAKSKPRFALGDRVRTLNINPPSHTRLPRYCRDKPGTIARVHGPHVFPDAHAAGRGEDPRWLYGVRFEARDLWGPQTTASAVFVDCWEPYLEAR
jgi:nitrile hydratase subunit beta